MSLSINLSLNSSCCGSGTGLNSSVTGLSRDLIKITGENFISATAWAGSNNEGVGILPSYSLKVFFNDASRYLDEGVDWERTSTGINILMPGFDATTSAFTFYIHINKV